MNCCQSFRSAGWLIGGFAIAAALLLPRYGNDVAADDQEQKQKERLFELRTYTTHEGRLDALHARFRNHTNKIFQKHGMTLVAYWTPTDQAKSKNTLIYVLAFPNKAAHAKAWAGFRDDPEWKSAYKASISDGKIVKKVESQLMRATDYSPIK